MRMKPILMKYDIIYELDLEFLSCIIMNISMVIVCV